MAIAFCRLLRYCYPFPDGYNSRVQASLKYKYMFDVIFGIGKAALYPTTP